jgi:hypothetical protein
MRVEEILAEHVGECLEDLDRRNVRTVLGVVEAAARARRLSLTALGRSLASEAKPKHSIKRVDRLLGNAAVHASLDPIYTAVTRKLVGSASNPAVLIDWTGGESEELVVLSASLATTSGRAVLIRSEVYPLRKLHSAHIESRFLRRLHNQLAAHKHVTVVVDAGFRVPFFRSVLRLGWNFVGRLTRQMYVGPADDTQLYRVDCALFPIARATPKSMGLCWVTTQHRFAAHVVVMKNKSRGRHGSKYRTRKGTHPGAPAFKKHQRRGNEPWVLITSLGSDSATKIAQLYARRMQIEQCFRDTKNERFGLALQDVRTHDARRLEVLLLVAALVSLLAMLIGTAIEHSERQRDFQANTIKRRVLSRFVLGLAVLAAHKRYLPSRVEIRRAAAHLITEIGAP